MSTRTALLGAAIAVTAMIGGSAANAAILTATYTGTVAYGFDETGEFGTAGAYLSGQAFTAIYKYDTSLGYTYNSGYYEQNYGGSSVPNTTPLIDSTLTIGAATIHVGGAYQGYTISYNDGYYGYIQNQAYDYDYNNYPYGYSNRYMSTHVYTNSAPTTLPTSFSSGQSGPYGPYSGGYYENSSYDYFTGEEFHNYAQFVSDHVTISSAPEPATWGLMLVGFGGLGAMLRRRRAAATLSAA